MMHVKGFRQLFESSEKLTQEQIAWLDECTLGTWTFNEETREVDVRGNFNCQGQELTDFKGVRFGHVAGFFKCSFNKLPSLDGAPRSVDGYFECQRNHLTSLEGLPEGAEMGDFNCRYNWLTTLKGAPRKVNMDFDCAGNQLTSLEYAPQEVGSGFNCHGNNITSLKGAPEIVRGPFI